MDDNKRAKIRFDVALSFAGEDREYVEDVATFLKSYGIRVFYDKFEEDELWGRNLYDHLFKIYSEKADCVVMFISKNYIEKPFPKVERAAALSEAFNRKGEYILPVKLDNTEVSGPISTIGHINGMDKTPKQISKLIVKKIGYKINKRWWGKWKLESLLQCVSGDLFIYNVDDTGFNFEINVINGAHTGNVRGRQGFYLIVKLCMKKTVASLHF